MCWSAGVDITHIGVFFIVTISVIYIHIKFTFTVDHDLYFQELVKTLRSNQNQNEKITYQCCKHKRQGENNRRVGC